MSDTAEAVAAAAKKQKVSAANQRAKEAAAAPAPAPAPAADADAAEATVEHKHATDGQTDVRGAQLRAGDDDMDDDVRVQTVMQEPDQREPDQQVVKYCIPTGHAQDQKAIYRQRLRQDENHALESVQEWQSSSREGELKWHRRSLEVDPILGSSGTCTGSSDFCGCMCYNSYAYFFSTTQLNPLSRGRRTGRGLARTSL